jgi:hypothetical protein
MSSFFVSPQAEYRASRLMQIVGRTALFAAATSTGNVIANFDGRTMTLLKLERDGSITKMDDVNMTRVTDVPVIEIE